MVYFDESDYPSDLKSYVDPGDIVITRWGTIGKIGFHFGQERLFFNQNVCKLVFKDSLIKGKYFYYLLLSKSYQIKQCISGAALPIFDIEKFKNIKIPVPSLEKQQEIANKLDKFSKLSEELQEELQEELSLRKKQYEYYRDELLSFKQDNKIKWLTLGEIITNIYGGSEIDKKQITTKGTPCVRYGNIYTNFDIWFDSCLGYVDEKIVKIKKYAYKNDLLVATRSNIKDNIGKTVAYLGENPILVSGSIVILKHNQNAKYLAYALSTTNAQKQKTKGKIEGIPVQIIEKEIKGLKIPIPSLEKQQEIVDLLDKFWKLSNDIKGELPAEILLRKQQYEYYRDKLLSR